MTATAASGGEAAAVRSAKFDNLQLPEERDNSHYYGHITYHRTGNQVQLMKTFRELVISGHRKEILSIISEILPGHDQELRYLTSLIVKRDSPETTKEALLSAISLGSRPLVELILQLFVDFPHEERSGCTNCPMFAPHITPLILACILNNFAIVETLLLRGHSITVPHHANCNCESCRLVAHSNVEHLRKVDVYRAVSSEAFLWLATSDPFAAAAALATDLEQSIDDDNVEFIDVYNGLHQNVQNFALRLVEQCWKVEEVDLFLSQRSLSLLTNCQQSYPRVRMGLDASLKDFAASVPVQRACATLWYQGWGNFGSNLSRDSFRILRHVFAYPFIALLFVVTNGKVGGSFNVPLARYISYTSSYVVFLCCLVGIRSARGETSIYDRDMINPPWQALMELYTFLYVMGLLLERYLELSRRGVSNFFSLWWRWFDFMLLGLFMLAFHIWCTAIVIGFKDPEIMKKMHRRHWPFIDYFFFYDVFLATGCIFAFWKTFYFFQLVKGVGATIISIGRCVSQIYSYLFVMGIIMFSFAIGLNILSSPYLGATVRSHDGTTAESSDFFQSIPNSARHLYWAFYGYMEYTQFPLAVGNAGPEQNRASNTVVEYAIEGISMSYHAILIITLLNLMISLLVKKADEVLDNEDLEFKYTRAAIYSEFYEPSFSVPPPFNILHWIIRPIFCLASGEYELHWPEIYIRKDLIDPSKDKIEEERVNLLVMMFKRFRACRECLYKSAFRANIEKEKTEAVPAKVTFMNDT
ncbi:spe-41 [Pristionchus pacificus]|uniref:Spe-41 n=1 Tax=Pristionchus pacificus TaxID=54126 RepID=A0A2A6CGG1_PRIPA|nr:spe-41 [Pristionchus pacificus]|eukprot:PDM77111.1 spe-41 [Pristionchus pacificus]